MDKNAAKNLVREVLQNSFNKERFIYLTRNILNHIEDAPFVYKGNLIFDDFADSIKTLERIGKYRDPEDKLIDILIVRLKKETTLERARTKQRNFIAKYLKGSRGGVLKDAALVAFIAPNNDDWRFSFVKMEYKFNEKGKVKEEFTPARRYSFLVGKNENSHTAQSRLLRLLLNKDDPKLEELEEAFKVEPVTKEFFGKYRDLFLRLKESLDDIVKKNPKVKADFKEKNVDTVVFAKKLLGQIVFLYFLQKKGGLGVKEKFGDGDRKFLRNLFEKAKKESRNFFNDYLEHLFYDALNNERRGSVDPSYHPYFDCKIPFLNGGLFEPLGNYDWKNTNIALPNELFSNDYRTKEGDIGTGILDIFDRFNFTIKEDEPLDKEVAIDPVLLGRLYEKFNAITSDNFSEYLKIIKSGKKGEEAKFNKQYGVYYTPPEIVQYMCKESLINYLDSKFEGRIDKSDFEKLVNDADQILENEKISLIKKEKIESGKQKNTEYKFKTPLAIRRFAKEIDDALANIKICDPAVGSGAFPIEMMNQIVNIRELFSVLLKTKKNRYDLKLECIENSLYGVDIDPAAIEICRLRFWLSLVVDEERSSITPLPNLDYKVMQGNSLLEEYEGIKLFDKSLLYVQLSDETEVENLRRYKNKIEKQLLEFYQQNPRWMNDKKIEKPEKLLALEKEHERIKFILKDKEKFKPQDPETPKLFGEEKKSKKMWEKLKELHHKYFSTFDESKLSIKEKIENFTWKLIEETLIENRQKSKFSKIQEIKKSGKNPFFLWEVNFPEIFANNDKNGGFDIVIANPPYIGEKGHKQIFREVKKGFLGKFYMGKMDIFYFFFHLSLNIAKDKGIISFITTNYYPTAMGAKKLRQDFKERAIIKKLINFNELKIFGSALGQHNMITILQKGQDKNAIAQTCITQRQGFATQEVLQQILNGQDKQTQYYQVSQNDLYDGDEYYIRLEGVSNSLNNPIQKVLNKIKSQGSSLGIICNVNQGIVTGADKVSKRHIEKYGIDANVGDGIFVLSDDEIRNLNLTKHDKEILKPWFKNSDIFRWRTSLSTTERLIYADKRLRNLENNSLKVYLLKFKKILDDSTVNSPYLHRPRDINFDSEKIVAPQRSPRNTFGYNEIPWYASADVYFITEKDKSVSLKYILVLLNSKLYYLWLYHRGKRKGETLELYQKPLSEVPIKKISKDQQKPFIDIVDKILAITKDDPEGKPSASNGAGDYLENPAKQAKVREYEKQIDQMVYKLYGLTPEEIRIVENAQS